MNNAKQIVEYMRSDIVKERFGEALGSERNAAPYITSVLLAVANNDALQNCTHESIYTSALRAATLRLSCDPSTKQAYLVPYGKNATLIVGYKGLYDLAVRTGRYRFIHVDKVYEGESIEFDRFTGAPNLVGNKQSNKVVGWSASFQMYDGLSKTIYMSVAEIHEHAQKYSKGYARKDGAWQTSPEAMEKKTILRRLITQWGYLDPSDAPLVKFEGEEEEIEMADAPEIGEIIDAEAQDVDEEESLRMLGY